MASFKVFPAAALAVVLVSAQASLAAEGGFSFYLPGLVGDIAIAQSSEPGLQVANTVFFQSGDAGAAVLQGNVNLGLDLTMALDIVSASYTFEQEVLGSGARLGDFQGESFGLGPGFIWFPAFAKGKLAVLGKWIHDFDATNRFESDYATLTVAWTF